MEKREKYTVIVPVNNYKPGQFELEMRYKHGRTEQLLSLQRTVEEEKHLISGWRTFIDEDKNLHQAERSKVPFVEVEENLERSRCQLETSKETHTYTHSSEHQFCVKDTADWFPVKDKFRA